jgi:hypothetical protein
MSEFFHVINLIPVKACRNLTKPDFGAAPFLRGILKQNKIKKEKDCPYYSKPTNRSNPDHFIIPSDKFIF